MKRYHPQRIEQKWQEIWEKKKLYRATEDSTRPKYYVLDMFPYPSGAGLHVGHVVGYTATDIIARYKRKMGYNVLHPMGWDSFGLPAEQYAIRTGVHPKITTEANIATYRRQLKRLGYSYDWEREVATSNPSFYRWTQWIFTKLYEKNLAYRAYFEVNYCPTLGTVLANEEVEDGRSKEGGYPVERRPLKQWVLRITEYADRLLDDLEELDWPEGIKLLQRHWIGKSEGAKIHFPLAGKKGVIEVFTTSPHTLFGVSYIVLAPEHPLLERLITEERREEVEIYRLRARSKSDGERSDLSDKSGCFLGSYVHHPLTQAKIPVWIANYVLLHYGTGAVMGVPAHDDRDFAFAHEHHLPILPVIDPKERVQEEERRAILAGKLCYTGEGVSIQSGSFDGLERDGCKKAIIEELSKKGVGESSIAYKLRDWLFSRQRYWGEPFPILSFEDGSSRLLGLDELPLEPPLLENFAPLGEGKSPLARVPSWVTIIDPKSGKKAQRETDTMPQWAGSCWYYLRFIDPHNQEKIFDPNLERYWLPVDLYIGGAEHAVLHLLYARFWHKVLYDLKIVSTKEPFPKLRNQGMVLSPSYKIPGGNYLPKEEVDLRGGEAFSHKSGEKLIVQMEKMSKSKLNGYSPDEVIEEVGADALRLYEMFMGPIDREKIWNSDAVSGTYRFLSRFYEAAFSDKLRDEVDEPSLKCAHKLLKGALRDFEILQFNTVIAKLMEFMNDLTALPFYSKEALLIATEVLYPLAPHLAEEVWEELMRGKDPYEELSFKSYPACREELLVEEKVTYVIQINGKVRAKIDLALHLGEEELLAEAYRDSRLHRYLDGQTIKKRIFVQGKLLNIVL